MSFLMILKVLLLEEKVEERIYFDFLGEGLVWGLGTWKTK